MSIEHSSFNLRRGEIHHRSYSNFLRFSSSGYFLRKEHTKWPETLITALNIFAVLTERFELVLIGDRHFEEFEG